jgi:hypothetical protein
MNVYTFISLLGKRVIASIGNEFSAKSTGNFIENYRNGCLVELHTINYNKTIKFKICHEIFTF